MNSNPALELALKKQRLQIAGEGLRRDFARHATGLTPIFTGADVAVDVVRCLRRHPEVVVATGVALVVARPSRAWRWGRRAFFGWQAWRRWRNFLDRPPAAG
jgi:hypothetical protein